MTTSPKFLHIADENVSGRFAAVAMCGRRVGRMSLVGEAEATCTKCLAESLAKGSQVKA